jgi:hypothetical protein
VIVSPPTSIGLGDPAGGTVAEPGVVVAEDAPSELEPLGVTGADDPVVAGAGVVRALLLGGVGRIGGWLADDAVLLVTVDAVDDGTVTPATGCPDTVVLHAASAMAPASSAAIATRRRVLVPDTTRPLPPVPASGPG